MNYPFGEHIVYTDCQPLLTSILKLLPFTYNYAIGIMHGLILFSFIITAPILYKIFKLLKVNGILAFFSSLAIAILSPQIQRLGGHFALAYSCIIPAGILFLLQYFDDKKIKQILVLVIYNSILFFIHPYFGLGLSLLCLTTIIIHSLIANSKKDYSRDFLTAFITGIVPIAFFKIFMFATDKHVLRPDEPYGVDIMGAAANFESVFTPSFGPFIHLLKSFIKSEHVEWEALSYIGFFPFLLLIFGALTLPIYAGLFKNHKKILALFISSILFLLFAFGLHITILEALKIKIAALNQFRAFGRFAWYFYFVLPIFLITMLSKYLETKRRNFKKIMLLAVGLIFLFFNLLEGHYLLTDMTHKTFQTRNVFNSQLLTVAEKQTIDLIKNKGVQAILPLPLFHIGSEVYQRNGDESIRPAMIYSFHTALPLLSVMMSRTSLPETETAIEILNRYKKNKPIDAIVAKAPFLVIKTGENLKEDEMRLIRQLRPFTNNGEQDFYVATDKNFKVSKKELSNFVAWNKDSANTFDNVLNLKSENKTPFIISTINRFETIAEIDSNRFESGQYTVSFHYHLKEKKFRYIHNNFIVVKKNTQTDTWEYFTSVRSTSGFYDGFVVFEEKIYLDSHSTYKFILNGPMKETYHISDFLLKPQGLDIKITDGKNALYNNYPG